MRKSFFQKTYNVNVWLIYFGFLSIILNFALQQLGKLLGNFHIPQLKNISSHIQDKLEIIEYFSKLLSIILITLVAFLIAIELLHRFRNDSILNYFKSIFQTIRFRHFLKQDETNEAVNDKENQITKTRINPVIQSFNSSISKCTIDVKNSTVSVVIQYPKTQQAQKILRGMMEQIKDKLWFKATRV